MPLSAQRWKQFAESRYAHEREALEFLRDVLQDRDPNFVYSNFEFIADDGSVNRSTRWSSPRPVFFWSS